MPAGQSEGCARPHEGLLAGLSPGLSVPWCGTGSTEPSQGRLCPLLQHGQINKPLCFIFACSLLLSWKFLLLIVGPSTVVATQRCYRYHTGGCRGRGHGPFCSTRPMLSPEMKGNCPPQLPECESLTDVGPSVCAQERATQRPESRRIIQPSLGCRGAVGWSVPRQRHKPRLWVCSWGLMAHVQPAGNHEPVSWSLSGALSRVHVQHPAGLG